MPKDIETVSIFRCLSCGDAPEFVASTDSGAFKEHLSRVHGVCEFKGRRQMVYHIDGEGFYETLYEIEIQDVKASHIVRERR